jgi:arginine-tRNA-protein transferase
MPQVDAERLDLYRRWHGMREGTRGWSPSALDEESYFTQFAFPHPCAREVTYWDDDAGPEPRLIGVGLCDETPRGWSAIYFFYDPAYADRSLGTFNILFQIDHARRRGIPHVYLGYRVAGCVSLKYKGSFRPHEVLVGRPAFHEEPCWELAADEPAETAPDQAE